MKTLSRTSRWLVAAVLPALFLIIGPSSAQTGVLTYGSIASAELSAQAPVVIFPFSGTEGDQVSVRIFATSPGLQPTVSLLSPTQQQLATNSGSPFSPGLAELNVTLPATGIYTILVSSADSTPGGFAIRLDGSAAPPPVELGDSPSEPTTLSEASTAVVYNVQADPNAPVTVTISTTTAGFSYAAALRDQQGNTISMLSGSDTAPITSILPPGTITYTFEVRPLQGGSTGDILLSAATSAAASPQETPTTPADTTGPTVTATPPLPTAQENDGTVCSATANSMLNVRSGPATTYEIISSLPPGQTLPVTGISTGGDWYVLALPDSTSGWVFGDLVTLGGPCDNLPIVAAPNELNQPTAAPTLTPGDELIQATPTPTPSNTPPNQQATATFTPSHTPTTPAPQATATFTPSYTPTTPPAAQVAPDDARFNNPLEIPLDNTASVLDFVSYPDGDREDRVRYSVSGMNPNSAVSGGRARLVISVSCFGDNTDQIEFFTGGQAYSCGATIVDREVTADSDTGSIVITAVGGEGTYVQWVLTGTATRIN